MDCQNNVPQFLHGCISRIEQLATESLAKAKENSNTKPIDLISVYQQSALVSTLNELHRNFAHQLPTIDESADIVQLAQLVKSFLRLLPGYLIPEPNYPQFCDLANSG